MVSNLYLNVDKKDITVRITIGGVLLTSWTSAQWSYDFNRPPTATIVVPNPAPGVVTFEADVTIETGFNGLTEREFTGTVLNVNPSERNCRIECQGMSKVLENTFQAVLVTVDGSATAQELVEEQLADSGLAAYEVNLPAWTPGTVCPRELTFETYSEAILKIAEVDGGRWYELPTGTVRVEPRDPIPSLTSWRTYFSGVLTGMSEAYPPGVTSGRPRLRHCSRAQKARDVKNEAHVRGCTYDQTNPDGTKVAIDVEGDAMAGSPWVRKPDGTQAYSTIVFPNELIDTPVKAGTVAARLVTLWNRLLTQVTAEVDGDPQVFLGGTVRVEDPAYSGTTGNWFTEGYMTRVTDAAFTTVLTLLGGPESGFTVNICPFALFTYLVEREVMGDRLWAIVGLDGSGSVDPDGEIVSWCWEDNQDPMLISGCSDSPYWTERVDPDDITGSWLVTLITTDDQGCEDDITLPVTVAPGSSLVKVPAIFVAFDVWFSATPDGGLTWNDQTGVGVVCVSAKPDQGTDYGIAVYGTSGIAGGELWLTEDYCATPLECVLSGVASPFADVSWDMNHPDDVWAVTEAGELYRSQANGVFGSWQLYRDLNTLPWLVPADGEHVRASRIATPCCEGVWVFGGQYIDWSDAGCLVGWPLICWDAALDNHWSQAAVGGELLEDLIAYGGCTGTASSVGPVGLQIALGNREFLGHSPGDWQVLSTDSPSGLYYLGVKNLQGTLFRKTHVNRLFREGEGGYLHRSDDGGVTWADKSGYGVTADTGCVDFALSADGLTLWLLKFTDYGVGHISEVWKSTNWGDDWTQVYIPTTWSYWYGRAIACDPNDPDKIVVCGRYSTRLTFVYSDDGGASWHDVEPTDGVAVGTGPQGTQLLFGNSTRLVLATGVTPYVRTSDDWGDHWTTRLTSSYSSPHLVHQMIHAANPNEFFLAWTSQDGGDKRGIARSVDNGATWTEEWATGAGVGINHRFWGLAWDETVGALWTHSYVVNAAPPAKTVFRWTEAAGWEDMTDDLGAEASYDTGERGICAPVWAAGAGEFAGGPTDLYVREAASREAEELSIIFNSETWMTGVYYTPTIFDDGSGWQRCRDLPDKSRGRWIAPDLNPAKVVFAFDDEVTYQGNVDPVTLAMTAVVAPATLDIGPSGIDEPNHGEWIGAFNWWMPGVYLVAAEGPNQPGLVYKSFDRFISIGKLRPATGFTDAPAGARGKMIALSGAAAEGYLPGWVLMAGRLTGDNRFAAWRKGSTDWESIVFPTQLGGNDCLTVRAITADLWFVLGFDETHEPNGANCAIVRTKNAGGTWAAFTQPKSGNDYWQDFTLDAAGRIWGVTLDVTDNANGTVKIWWSEDEGDSWTLVYTDVGSFPPNADVNRIYRITAHPTNQDIIVAWGADWGHNPLSIWTNNRGVDWTRTVGTGALINRQYGQEYDGRMTSAGRLVVVATGGAGVTDISAMVTDDQGVNWSVTMTWDDGDHMMLGPVGTFLGDRLYLLSIYQQPPPAWVNTVYESKTAGSTWAPLDNAIPYRATYDSYEGGIAFDDLDEALYGANEGGGNTLNEWLVARMIPVAQDGNWADFSDTLLPIGAFTSYDLASRFGINIAAIPR